MDGQGDVFKVAAVGRMYTISPRQGECYFLRLLLNEVLGPVSYENLRSVDGHVHPTYRAACQALQLLENDHHLTLALEEAAVSVSAGKLRSLFSIILSSCTPNNPIELWQQFRDAMAEDFLFQHRRNVNDQEAAYTDAIYNQCLCDVEDKFQMMGGQSVGDFGLPVPHRVNNRMDREYWREINFNHEQLAVQSEEWQLSLTDGQRTVYNKFMDMVIEYEQGRGGNITNNIMFLDAPGGTGKTFLVNLILAKIRSRQKIALATASSGIASTLLHGGRTMHSTFKIPLDTHRMDQPTCNIKRGTAFAKVLQDTSAIIVDEAPMTHRTAYEAIDRTVQDITRVNRPMGGIPTLLCGDFRQILPVVKNGTRANIVEASLKKSHLWRNVQVERLTTNMRAHLFGNVEAEEFSNLLLQVGNGTLHVISEPDTIAIPTALGQSAADLEELKNIVYPDLARNGKSPEWLAERAIVSPLNDNVNRINNWLMDEFPGELKTYKSIDTAITDEDAVQYPVELLNSMEISGMPPHILKLKVGCPIMILRSLEPPKTTNGTRCVVTRLHDNVIEAIISCGPHKGEVVMIPRIPLIPSDSGKRLTLAFEIKTCFTFIFFHSRATV